MRVSRSSGWGLAARQFSSSPGASAALALLVLVVATSAVATPRALDALITAGLQREVAALSPLARDLSATELGGPALGFSTSETGMDSAVEDVLGRQLDLLTEVAETMPAPLRRALDEPRFTVAYDPAIAPAGTSLDNAIEGNVYLTIDPWLASHVRMVEGDMPSAATAPWPGEQGALDLVLSADAATELSWNIGDERTLNAPGGGATVVRLSGTFEAVDAQDEFWRQVPVGLEPSAVVRGLGAKVVTASAFIAGDGWRHLTRWEPTPRLHVWYPLRAEALSAPTVEAFSAALREFTREQHRNGDGTATVDFFGVYREPGGPVVPVQTLSLASNVTGTLDQELARATVTTAVVGMAVAGPLGVVVAVLFLSVSLLLLRRRDAVVISAARGASRLRLRLGLAAEGLALGVPAATLGAIAAVVLVPGPVNGTTLLLPTLVALAPAALLAARLPAARRERADLDGRVASRVRLAAESVVVLLAAAGVVLLTQRGIDADAPVALDPLLLVTPLLLTLAACVIVLRLYPVPLAAVARRAARGTGLTASLGAARGLRDQLAGLAPVLAMVVAVSITTFSAVLLSTTSAGIDDAAADQVGGDVSMVVEAELQPLRDAVDAVPGVTATAAVWADDERSLEAGGREVDTGVVAADTVPLARIQSELRSGIHSQVDLTREVDGAIPAIVSETLLAALDGEDEIVVRGHALRVVGSAPDAAPFISRQTWLLVDSAFQREVLGGVSPHLLLVDVSDASTAAQLAELAPVTTRVEVAARMHQNPAIFGLGYALGFAIALSALLCAAAVALTLVLGAPSRARVFSVLRALGGGRRLERGLLAWEIVPSAALALLTGTLLGLGLPLVVLAGVDLRQFTGGTTQPPVVIDPAVPAIVAVGLVVVVSLAAAVALLLSRSRTPHDGMENHD